MNNSVSDLFFFLSYQFFWSIIWDLLGPIVDIDVLSLSVSYLEDVIALSILVKLQQHGFSPVQKLIHLPDVYAANCLKCLPSVS